MAIILNNSSITLYPTVEYPQNTSIRSHVATESIIAKEGEMVRISFWKIEVKKHNFNTHCMRLVSSIIVVGRSPWIGLFCVYNP